MAAGLPWYHGTTGWGWGKMPQFGRFGASVGMGLEGGQKVSLSEDK